MEYQLKGQGNNQDWKIECFSTKLKDIKNKAIEKLNSIPEEFNTNGKYTINLMEDNQIIKYITSIKK